MDAFGYLRVSTKEQNDSGFGLDVQRAEIEQYALGHRLRITEWFSDDISGDTHSRPALDRMQAALNQGQNRTVIIHRPDRLARKSWIAEMLMDQWHSRGINIHFQNRGHIENTPEARFQIGIFCQHGELDKRLLLQKLNGARRNKATQHQMPVGNGTAPFGLLFKGRRKDQTVEIVPKDAETIQQIFEWFVNRGMQIQAIADELTRLGVPTASDRYPERFGKKSIRERGEWNPQVIYNMLRHPVYKGRMPHFRKVQTVTEVDGEQRTRRIKRSFDDPNVVFVPVPAIIDPAIWDAAQEKLNSNVRPPRRFEYLCSGRVTCQCGYKMAGSSNGSPKSGWDIKTYYRCPGNSKIQGHTCRVPYFRAELVDTAVWNWIKGTVLDPERLAQAFRDMRQHTESRRAELVSRREQLEKQIAEADTQMQRLVGLYLEGTIDRAILDTQQKVIQRRQTSYREGLQTTDQELNSIGPSDSDIASLAAFGDRIRRGLDNAANFETRHKILELLRAKVMLGVDDGGKFVEIDCAIPGAHKRVSVNGTDSEDPSTALWRSRP